MRGWMAGSGIPDGSEEGRWHGNKEDRGVLEEESGRKMGALRAGFEDDHGTDKERGASSSAQFPGRMARELALDRYGRRAGPVIRILENGDAGCVHLVKIKDTGFGFVFVFFASGIWDDAPGLLA